MARRALLARRRARRRKGQRGFTLLELVISVALLSTIMVLMYQSLGQTIETRNMVYDELQGPKVANAILAQIFKDFRYIYYGGLQGESGFRGKAVKMAGMDADRVAFITARRTRTVGTEDDGRRTDDDRESPLTEVGYACRPHPRHSQWLELWRREDYFVDSKPTEGGFYSLVYDKIRNFRLRFFPIPEEATEKQGLEEWDSATKKGLPYAILLKIEFDVNEPLEGETYEPDDIDPIHRILLLRAGYSVEWGGSAPAAPGTGPGMR
ncbi:MAG: prepilin-type N-terminal cleavage/methylation domain-containing protein [Planctomycetota bacterium]|nr:prepilin-type N-terminal cleavage/methylation domain-containing protein [Planctomycetota bacterium]